MAVKVRQHKGKWWVFIDHKGKRKAKCIGTSKRAADLVAEKIQAKISLGQFELVEEKKKPILFADYAAEWLKTSVAVRCSRPPSKTMSEPTRFIYGRLLVQNSCRKSHENRSSGFWRRNWRVASLALG